ncbi:ABC transporter permease [Rhodovulum sulfidophilum]|uniref:ABC transporter permease n=1 Tax=Rhodovulum sulfidophilum TaxID=35806 RepID=A0ABS1RVK9_RHOSU|nr:ABC transporter permease [Rhodovulum sulfidophilum]MBK5923821.1 ABC transporter permease [Rhodovulum sulfidophilum]MBL3562560.1 ABC transporter permease [Rhodovulum sulfidophilum]MBL3567420.1 ABC transporter permease [Rhodovulum sulfidophilum]MBL3586590.1 ABC transporter permease [Rhodovulum sulfidophilum]MBL3609185.1 ABC transporter permease [Rhodovulum sulfidophilum]
MFSYLLRRLILVLPVAFGVSVICFLLVQIAPGDPLTAIMPVDATAEEQAAMRAAYGLDKPLPLQYAIWVGNLAQGDMGRSIATGRPVAGEVFGAVQNSLLLAVSAAVIAFPIGIFLGFLAGYFRDSALDKAVTAVSIAGVSVPNYWLGIVLVIIFSVNLGWLPSMGAGPGGSRDWSWNWEHMRHLVLPAVTLAVVPIGIVSRTVRALSGDILSMDFVQALYAKGMTRFDVLIHVGRNAASTALSVMGLQLGYLLGGSILIETVFNWPGSGFLLSNAIFQRDLPLLQGTILVLALFFVAMNLIVDVAQAAIDPRVKRS